MRWMRVRSSTSQAAPARVPATFGITWASQRGAVRREVDAADRRVNRLTVTVDLTAAPWSALRMFDDAFSAAAIAADPDEASRLAAALDELTASAANAMA